MAMVEVSIVPVGTNSPSVSQYVALALKVLQAEKDLKYELTAMGTILEGEELGRRSRCWPPPTTSAPRSSRTN